MPNDAQTIKELEICLKSLGWKKVYRHFHYDVNPDAISHFFIVGTRKSELLVQAGTSNRRLNRVSWDIFGLDKDFGKIQDQIANGCKCAIWRASELFKFEVDGKSAGELAKAVSESCLRKSELFSTVEKIESSIKNAVKPNGGDAAVLLCIAVLEKKYGLTRDLIRQEHERNPAFKDSGTVFDHAEKLLQTGSYSVTS